MSNEIDPEKLAELRAAYIDDMNGALSVSSARIGERLGLYSTLADSSGMTAVELADKLGLSLRMIQEWLMHQGGGQYVSYDADTEKWFLSPEQKSLTVEGAPNFMLGLHQAISGLAKNEEAIAEVFKHGNGLGWGDQDEDVYIGCGRFFRTSYENRLVSDWFPQIEGLQEMLAKGARVADIGCGLGYSTMTMAEAFPNSTFVGFDCHGPSVEFSRNVAKERGLKNCHFEVAGATDFPNSDFRVVSSFNCLHDVQHADKAARHFRDVLPDDGILFLAEPMAGHTIEENFSGVGRIMAGCSVLCCTPQGMTDNGMALGTVVTDERLKGILLEAGFSSFKRAYSETFTRVFDIRP